MLQHHQRFQLWKEEDEYLFRVSTNRGALLAITADGKRDEAVDGPLH
jgi:hypothetical protein